jgi:hypothetical protein
VGLEDDFSMVGSAVVESFHRGLHGVFGLLAGVLADGGEVDVRELRRWAVVVADDGDRGGNV